MTGRLNKAVFLDRDGTLNVDAGYVYRVEDFVYMPGAKAALRLLQEAGFLLVVITNQSGVARGLFREEDVQLLNDWMIDDLKRVGIRITRIYYCPHLPEISGECDCRKPRTGLYRRAIHDLGLDLSRCWAIGDNLRDVEICKTGICRGALIGKDPIGHTTVRRVDTILDAARYVTEGDR